jgi:cell division protein FtsQ
MDSVGRVIRALAERALSPVAFAYASTGAGGLLRRRTRRVHGVSGRLLRAMAHPLFSTFLTLALFGGVFAYAVQRSGAYARFIDEVGTPGDILARALGMGVDTVTISGLVELKETDVLKYAGVKARNSLPYLDAAAIRDQLRNVPLVKDADVRKLYPNRIAIRIVERRPYALWQKDGQFAIVSAEGVAIDTLNDERYAKLPVIIGAGANERIEEYKAIMAAAGDLAGRVKAAALVSGRRWSVFFQDDVEARLPEREPAKAMERLAQLQRDYRLFDKDVKVIDLRAPDRLVVRLSDEAAARRLENVSRLTKGKV